MIRRMFTFDYKHLQTRVRWQTDLGGKIFQRAIGRVLDIWAGSNLSIRAKILLSLVVVILMMGTANAVLMFQMLNYSNRYNAIIENITTANKINDIKPTIDDEMWNIVAGKFLFGEGKQYRDYQPGECRFTGDDGQHRLARSLDES